MLVILDILYIFLRKKFTGVISFKIKGYFTALKIFNILCVLALLVIASLTFYFQILNFDWGTWILIIIFALFFTVNAQVILLKRWRSRLLGLHSVRPNSRIETDKSSEKSNNQSKLWGIFYSVLVIIINIFGIGGIAFLIVVSLSARPFVVDSTPDSMAYMQDADQEIVVNFDVPVDSTKVKFNISPETPGQWQYTTIPLLNNFITQAKFIPQQSFYPGNKIVVYLTGLQNIAGSGEQHEQSIEFFAPKVPQILEITPAVNQEHVPVDADLVANLDAPNGEFINWKYEITPAVSYETATTSDEKLQVNFIDALQQDTQYKVDIYQTPRSYDVQTGVDIQVGETVLATSTVFKTVTTPLIQSKSPEGSAVLVNSNIRVVFDEPMYKESVESSFRVAPATEGSMTWEDDKTLVFDPLNDLPKETDFTITIGTGILNTWGGKTKEDIVFSFRTIGKVVVDSFYPGSDTYGWEPSTTNISVTFNQEVDHASAQEHFVLSPSAAGSFSWNGNTMTYTTAGNISFSTRYDYRVTAGVRSIYGLDSVQDFSGFFVTRDYAVMLGVPLYYQQETFTCNLATARMALAYKGVYVSESDIKYDIGICGDPNACWVEGYGTHWGPVANYISNYRPVEIKSGWNVAELAAEVNAGNPVILWWYNRYSQPPGAFTIWSGYTGYKGMHSEVVVGFLGNPGSPYQLITNDPWRGQLYYNTDFFWSNWAYLGYTAVVVR